MAGLLATPIVEAAVYQWSNDGSLWTSPVSWLPAVVPAGGDTAFFGANAHGLSYVVQNANVNTVVPLATLELNNNFLGGTYDFGNSSGVIRLGGSGTQGFIVRGFGIYRFKGPDVDGSAGGVVVDVGTDAELYLTEQSELRRIKQVRLKGRITLDDNSIYLNGRILNLTPIMLEGGTLAYNTNSSSLPSTTLANYGALSSVRGFSTVEVNSNGGISHIVNFNMAGGFNLRQTTYSAIRFTLNGNGFLGGPGPLDAAIQFGPGVIETGPLNLLSVVAGSLDVGYATTIDGNGTSYAAFDTALNSIVAANPTIIGSTPATLAASGPGDYLQFNDPGGLTPAFTSIRAAVIRIQGNGGAIDMGTAPGFAIATGGIMLDGPNPFSLMGDGQILSTVTGSPVYFYVNDPNNTLYTSMMIGTQNGPTDFAGPGFLELVAPYNQLMLNNGPASGLDRLNLLGGTFRGGDAQIGFNTSALGAIAFRGGVLEINDGHAFQRTVDPKDAFGSVNWSTFDPDDSAGGSGGFSAINFPAFVKLGTSGPLVWGDFGTSTYQGFVQDGYALIFGSTQSNTTLTWLNDFDLGSGTTASKYVEREIEVIKGTGPDKTIIDAVISGNPFSDLVKTGYGTLELAGNNTMRGNVIIEQGTLRAANMSSAPSLHNVKNIIISPGATLEYGADKQIANATTEITMTGGSTFNDNGYSDSVGFLTLTGNATLDMGTGSGTTILVFNGFTDAAYVAGTVLAINNWSGLVTGGGLDQIYFPISTTAAFTSFLSSVDWTGSGYGIGAIQLSSGEIVPTPEPGVLAAGLLLIGAIGWRERHRFKSLLGPRRPSLS